MVNLILLPLALKLCKSNKCSFARKSSGSGSQFNGVKNFRILEFPQHRRIFHKIICIISFAYCKIQTEWSQQTSLWHYYSAVERSIAQLSASLIVTVAHIYLLLAPRNLSADYQQSSRVLMRNSEGCSTTNRPINHLWRGGRRRSTICK